MKVRVIAKDNTKVYQISVGKITQNFVGEMRNWFDENDSNCWENEANCWGSEVKPP